MPSARIESDFSLRGALLKPADEDFHDGGNQRFFDPRATLIADRMQVSGNVYLDNNLESTGTLRLVNARIGGSVQLTDSTIDLSDGRSRSRSRRARICPARTGTGPCTWTVPRSPAASTPATRGSPARSGWWT